MMTRQPSREQLAIDAGRAISIEEELLRRQLQALLDAPSTPPRMTYAAFLEWADEDTLAEWVDGEVIMASPALNQHQDLARFLTAVLSGFVEAHDLGLEGARYRLVFSGQAGDYTAQTLPDFRLRVEWLWQQPLPRGDEVLLEIGGAVYARQLIERLRRRGFLP